MSHHTAPAPVPDAAHGTHAPPTVTATMHHPAAHPHGGHHAARGTPRGRRGRGPAPLDHPRPDADGPVHGRPRRLRRERRPALDRGVPVVLQRRLPVGRLRLRPALRRTAALRRPALRPLRPPHHVPDRADRLHHRVPGLRHRILGGDHDHVPRRPGHRRRHAHPRRPVHHRHHLHRQAALHRPGHLGHHRQHGHRRRRAPRRCAHHHPRLALHLLRQRSDRHRRRRPDPAYRRPQPQQRAQPRPRGPSTSPARSPW